MPSINMILLALKDLTKICACNLYDLQFGSSWWCKTDTLKPVASFTNMV